MSSKKNKYFRPTVESSAEKLFNAKVNRMEGLIEIVKKKVDVEDDEDKAAKFIKIYREEDDKKPTSPPP
jgi:hypothetical protein